MSDIDCESGGLVKRKIRLTHKKLIKWSLLIGSVVLLVFIISGFIALLAMVSSIKFNVKEAVLRGIKVYDMEKDYDEKTKPFEPINEITEAMIETKLTLDSPYYIESTTP